MQSMRRRQRGAKVVHKEDGLLTTSLIETKTVFAPKFAGMLGGSAIESVAALSRELPQFFRVFEPEDTNLEISPSCLDTFRLLKKATPGRGLGLDAIGVLLKSGASQICRLVYPVLMRAVTQISPPLHWKMGSCLNCSRKATIFSLIAIVRSRV